MAECRCRQCTLMRCDRSKQCVLFVVGSEEIKLSTYANAADGSVSNANRGS